MATLLSLPPELRVIIYSYAFAMQQPMLFNAALTSDYHLVISRHDESHQRNINTSHEVIALPMACRLVMAEASPLTMTNIRLKRKHIQANTNPVHLIDLCCAGKITIEDYLQCSTTTSYYWGPPFAHSYPTGPGAAQRRQLRISPVKRLITLWPPVAIGWKWTVDVQYFGGHELITQAYKDAYTESLGGYLDEVIMDEGHMREAVLEKVTTATEYFEA